MAQNANRRARDAAVRENDHPAGLIVPTNSRTIFAAQAAIRAELIGSNRCCAEGFSARAASPVLAICRRLIQAGVDPGRPLHVYRGDVLCLVIRNIGEGARLTVKERPFGPVFEPWVPFSTPPMSPPIRQNGQAATTLAGGAP
jgi:hypothetical protein